MGILAELQRRRVFATGAIYIPASWAAAEICLEIFDRFGAPAWAGDVIVVLFLLGFPVALLLSWLFDVTPDGVNRASPGTPLGIVALLGSGLFLSVGGYLSYQTFSGRLDEIRLVVLPLHTPAMNQEIQPYGAGVADHIRNALRAIDPFKVTARTSSEAMAQAGLDIPAIAARLGVQYVIEGSLEKLGSNLAVSISIIDDGGEELWSERFEREAADLFDLQNDLVRAAALQLGVEESNPQLRSQIRKPARTTDPEAHRLLLSANYASWITDDNPEAGGKRLKLLKQARGRDPAYPDVYPALAHHYAMQCWGMDNRLAPDCEMAVSYANQGIELDPDLAEAYAVLAMIHSVRYEYEEAQAALDRYFSLPDNDIVSINIPFAYVNMARLQEAWDANIELYANDPLNPFAAGSLANWAWGMKHDTELVDYYEQIQVELTGMSILSGFPWMRMHRGIPLEQALAEAEAVASIWGEPEGFAKFYVVPSYDPSRIDELSAELDEWYARGDVRLSLLFGNQILFGDIERAMDLAFETLEEGSFNPVPTWLRAPNMVQFRAHPRYMELMEAIGVTKHWDRYGWPPFCEQRQGEWFCGLEFTL